MNATSEVPAAVPMLTVAEAAARAGKSDPTIRTYIKRGLLPAKRDRRTGHLSIKAEDIDRLFGSEPVAVAPAGD